MSQAKWCDVGNHPYSANDLNSTTISVEQPVSNQWGGSQPHKVTSDVCGKCAAESGFLGKKAQKEALAIEPAASDNSGKKLVDAEEYKHYLAYLESQPATLEN